MIPIGWGEIEALRLGRLEPGEAQRGGSAGPVARILADSRLVGVGDLFVALNTGVEHAGDARARGAATLVPDDQERALAALASLVREKSAARVVAVVGSVGKTTTKDILGALCSAVVPTIYPPGSLNNEIGLPLTVCRLEPDTEVLVTEMGMRGLGQIAELCEVARPWLTLVTGIGPEHLELVGSLENVARANAEAIEALPSGGVAVVPLTAAALEPYLGRDDVDVHRVDPADVTIGEGVARLRVAGRQLELTVPFAQRHLAENLLAAVTAYDALGLPLDRLPDAARRIALSPWRGEQTSLDGGGMVVNDAYNANPVSMEAALRDLAARSVGRRRVAILGEMAELGESSDRYHREIGEVVAESVDVLVAVGEQARLYMEPGVQEMHWLPDGGGAEEFVRPGDAVLVKASRAVGLEGVAERIANHARAWSAS